MKEKLKNVVQKETYIKRKYHAIQNFCNGQHKETQVHIIFWKKRHSTPNQVGIIAKKQRRLSPKPYIPKSQDDLPTPNQVEQRTIKRGNPTEPL